MGKKIVTNSLELAVQTNMMQRVVASNKVSYRLGKDRNASSASKEKLVLEQETITVLRKIHAKVFFVMMISSKRLNSVLKRR